MALKKNVLLIINSDLVNAGVPNVVMQTVRELSDRFSFDVLTYHSKDGEYDSEFLSYGGKIYKLSLLEYKNHKLTFPLRYFQIKKKIKRILKEKKYDVIHCHNGVESGIFLKYASAAGVPVRISHAHGTYTRGGSNKLLLWYHSLAKRLIRKNATELLACSTEAGRSLFCDAEFKNVLNPVVNYYTGERVEHNGCNLLQIGYFCKNKNQLFSIKLLKSLLLVGVDARLSFIGFPNEDGYYEKMLELIDELSLGDRVEFLPHNADKAGAFSLADAVLMPSFTEGLPIVALESQLARVECILSDRISRDADVGLAVFKEYGNEAAWRDAVIEIYKRKNVPPEININTELIERGGWCNRIGAIYNEE